MPKKDALYQALMVEETETDKNNVYGIETTLLTGNKEYFPEELQHLLPSSGVCIDKDFPTNIDDQDEYREAVRCTARQLLQYRKISQLVARSWLPGRENSLIRKLIMTAHLQPNKFIVRWPDDWIEKHLEQLGSKFRQYLSWKDEENSHTDEEKLYFLSSETKFTARFYDTIITPGQWNWPLIRLSLLLAGQVFLRDGFKLVSLSEPILSTYDICVATAITQVSWSDYIASFEEVAQPAANQAPPYYKVKFPYPPKPSKDELFEKLIEIWANAPEHEGDWPFYPDKSNDGYESDLVRNVLPPYPYIPPTSSV